MRRVGLLISVGLLLAACAQPAGPFVASAPEASAPPTTGAPTIGVPNFGVPTSAPAPAQPTAEVKPTDAARAAPTAAPTRKPVKSELEATDPATVKLASGRPQFVEFFAFW